MPKAAISLLALDTIPEIRQGDDLAGMILEAAKREDVALQSGDIVVIAQKIVSKAEGRTVDLSGVTPSEAAVTLAEKASKDARLLEVILRESREVLRAQQGVCIVEHRLGHIMANGGVDHSNVTAPDQSDDIVLLLPEDPDASALALRQRFEAAGHTPLGVVISDSFGRPWRLGTTGVAIGTAGPSALIDRRGEVDMFGRTLASTEIGFADGIASAAVLAMGEAAEKTPVVVVRGLIWTDTLQTARNILRPREKDMFR
ncbi:coenzyme F420-0:L-glutamate ligase [Leisingera daeponensis]|uniref:coenzyme F420-0:L-glutamate ligase n=1 Tax=Leisingera daeponensis TaxID=405746 RepID=UPI001C962C88|nr:coenzyme F420-0:L-glutamate ligase [Leisingera daeponensis]MBY6058764.1 coenzyme F420-0:L-glutamate ligase [Leisingera daeponensis]